MAGWTWCCRRCRWVWFELGRPPEGVPFVCTRCGNEQIGSI